MKPPLAKRLADIDAEAVRQSHAAAIAELQQQALKVGLASGRLLGPPREIITVATYTPTPGTSVIILEGAGGGGGGGGAQGVAGTVAAGGGGASGAHATLVLGTFGRPLQAGLATPGAPGAGGSTAGGNGATGGDSTIVIGGVTYVFKGGGGGLGMLSGAGHAIAAGGQTIAGSSSNFVSQDYGRDGIRLSGIWLGGSGGSTEWGTGGAGGFDGNGGAATGIGGGGGGAGATATGRSGGNGTGGGFRIWEYA